MAHKAQKPGRPFGVTLAIVVSIVLYSIVPLLEIGMILLVEQRFRRIDDTPLLLPDGTTTMPGVSGGDFRGDITDERLILQAVLGAAFLVIAVFAWRGKPKFMRFVMMGAVVLLTTITLGLTVIPSMLDRIPATSGGSLDALTFPLLCLQFVSSVLVPIYVIWYLNRAPARAFYRGHYLEE